MAFAFSEPIWYDTDFAEFPVSVVFLSISFNQKFQITWSTVIRAMLANIHWYVVRYQCIFGTLSNSYIEFNWDIGNDIE